MNIKENWFKIMVIVILAVGIGFYSQDQQTNTQLRKEKQENDYKLKRAEVILKGEKEERIKEEVREQKKKEGLRKLNLELCLEDADEAYWDWIEYNGTYNEKEGTYWATDYHWNEAEKRKKSKEDKCFKQYN